MIRRGRSIKPLKTVVATTAPSGELRCYRNGIMGAKGTEISSNCQFGDTAKWHGGGIFPLNWLTAAAMR
jgi:hypothetical protein